MPDQPKRTISAVQAFLLCFVVAVVTYFATANAYRFQPKPANVSAVVTQAQPATQETLSSPAAEPSASPTPEYYTVSRVLEPTSLKLADGTTVCLIGVANPSDEMGESVQREALAFSKGLVEGKRVRLEYEAEYDKDTDGHPLAYVYLEDGTLLNAEIIKKGYGNSTTSYSYHLSRDFNRYELAAQKRGIGLWDTSDSDSTETAPTEANTEVPSVTVTAPPIPLPTFAPSRTYTPSSTESYSSTPAQQREPYAPTYVPPPTVYKLPVAENGSYYGEISEATGRPKTVHVDGYTRSDGTYVRGHYRSAPRRH